MKKKPTWFLSGFDWNSNFSARQTVNGLSLTNRQPLQFVKAVQSVHLCYTAALELHKSKSITATPDQLIDMMWIEPAVYYIRDFDKDVLSRLLEMNPHAISQLCNECEQATGKVFQDMAAGYTVTKSLAVKTHAAILKMAPGFVLGDVAFWHRNGVNKSATLNETLSD